MHCWNNTFLSEFDHFAPLFLNKYAIIYFSIYQFCYVIEGILLLIFVVDYMTSCEHNPIALEAEIFPLFEQPALVSNRIQRRNHIRMIWIITHFLPFFFSFFILFVYISYLTSLYIQYLPFRWISLINEN